MKMRTSRVGRSATLFDDGVKREQGLQYPDLLENVNGYCPVHATGVQLPDDFVVTPLQYGD